MITPYAPPPLAPALSTPAPSSANGTHRSHDRLTLVSPDPTNDGDADTNQPPLPALPTMTPAESSRKARRQQREAAAAAAAAQGQPGFVQETDAGRVALLPPSYDPAWAREGIPIDTSHPSTVSNPENVTTRPEPETARRSEDMGQQNTGTGGETDMSPKYDHLALGATIRSVGPGGQEAPQVPQVEGTSTSSPTSTAAPAEVALESQEQDDRSESAPAPAPAPESALDSESQSPTQATTTATAQSPT